MCRESSFVVPFFERRSGREPSQEEAKQSCTFQAQSWVCVPAYDSCPRAGVRDGGCGHSRSLEVYIPIHPVCIHICIYILRMYR